MRIQFAAQLNKLLTLLILIVVGITPLLISPLTTDLANFEVIKVSFIVVAVLALLVLWSLSWVVQGKVLITRTPLDLPLLILALVIILSAIFAQSRYIAVFGNFPGVHDSTVAWIAYILFYFIAVSNIKNDGAIKSVLTVLIGSTLLMTAISLLSYFGIYLPIYFAKSNAFSPAGSSFSVVSLIIVLLPLILFSLIKPVIKLGDELPFNPSIILAIIFGVAIALLGNLSTQIVALIGVGLVALAVGKDQVNRHMTILGVPIVISLVIFGLGLVSANLKYIGVLNTFRNNFPREIQLPLTASWQVSGSSFVASPWLGSGSGTYLFNFTQFKPVSLNNGNLWNLRFDSAYNEFLQVLGTLGLLGFLAFSFLAVVILSFAWKSLNSSDKNGLALPLSVSAILIVVLLAVHVSSPVMMIASLVILALLSGVNKSSGGRVDEIAIGIKASSIAESNLIVGDLLPVILFIPIILFVIFGLWNARKVLLGDYDHRLALNAASTNGIATYQNLVNAELVNPEVDLYHTDLAQTNFALANSVVAAKGPTQASPSGSLTDADKQQIQTLLSQSINEGRVATTLSPRNPANWEILASIYRQISGVAQNAIQFSLDAYGRAIQDDPMNPILRLNAGGIYYSIKNYDLAIRFFTDAINLKPDLANAYYNLSVALRDKGDLTNAQAAVEQALSLVDPKSPDYKVATDYLTDLKARIATGSAAQSQIGAPAAEQNGVLQQKNLPKVVPLGQPDNVATPSAAPKNPNANVPNASPSPSSSAK